jgi:putative copper resistance protein D
MTMWVPPRLDWVHAFTVWRFAPVTAGLVVVALALYLAGVRRAPGWSRPRVCSFVAGLAVVVAALMGSPAVYGDAGLFWVHMIQHLMLIMVAPWLLCYGHPLTLLSRAATGRAHRWVRAAQASPVIRLAGSPLVGLGAYAAVLFGVHLSSFMDAMMGSPVLMALEHVLYLGAGYLFLAPLLTADSPRPLPYPLRLFALFLGMTSDTIVGVVLLQATHPLFPAYARMQPPWGPGALADIHGGATVMWIGGDGLMFAMMLVVGATWLTDHTPQASRAGTLLESARRGALAHTGGAAAGNAAQEHLRSSGDIDDDDTARTAYNALLAHLNGDDPR